jgi:MFS family permease
VSASATAPTQETPYGWVVVGAAFALMFVGFGAAYSFGAFFHAFQAEFGAPRAHVALVFSVAGFVWFAVGAPGGLLADRFGARRVTAAGVACLALALWIASRAGSVDMLYATYSLGIGVGVGLTYVPSVGAVQPWFERHRALASGIAVAGIGAGNFVMPLLAAWAIGRFGWRGAYEVLAAFVLVLGGVAALVIRPPAHAPRGTTLPGMGLRQALAGHAFWLLYLSLFLVGVGVFVPVAHLASFAQDHGYSEAEGVALVSLIGLGSLAGRFAVGPFADRFDRIACIVALNLGLGLLQVFWWGSSAYWALAFFAVAFGVCYGGWVALMPTVVMELYGGRAVSGIIGCLYTSAGLGTLLGPWLAGAAFDAYGSYGLAILASALLSFLSAACLLVLIRLRSQRASRLYAP